MSARLALVTGGAGFLGAAVAARLASSGRRVRVLDDLSRGAWRRLEGVEAERVGGDVRDPEALRRAAEGADEVWHLAYINGTRHFYERPDAVLDVGVRGALNALDAAAACGARRFVLASSSEVYQQPPVVPTPEDVPLVVPDLLNPRYSYGGGKIISELLTVHAARRHGFRWTIVRPHNVYGPDMGVDHVVPELALKVLGARGADPVVTLQGDGSQTRSFCYVTDAAAGFLAAASDAAPDGVYHVGTPDEVTILDLAGRIAAALGRRVRFAAGPPAPGGTTRRCPDVSRLRALGWSPRVGLDEGLALACRPFLSRAPGEAA